MLICSDNYRLSGSKTDQDGFYFHGANYFPKCLYYNTLTRLKFLVFHIIPNVLNPLWCVVDVSNYWREQFRLPLEFYMNININIPILKAHKHNPSMTKCSTTSYEWTSAVFQLFFWIVYLQNIPKCLSVSKKVKKVLSRKPAGGGAKRGGKQRETY